MKLTTQEKEAVKTVKKGEEYNEYALAIFRKEGTPLNRIENILRERKIKQATIEWFQNRIAEKANELQELQNEVLLAKEKLKPEIEIRWIPKSVYRSTRKYYPGQFPEIQAEQWLSNIEVGILKAIQMRVSENRIHYIVSQRYSRYGGKDE